MGRADSAAVCLDSYGGDLIMKESAALNGGRAFLMQDTLSAGHASHIVRINEFQVDHPISQGILINAGFDVRFNGLSVNSQCEAGILVASGVYDWRFSDAHVLGCGKEGFVINGRDGRVTDSDIGHNSQLTTNTYDGMTVNGNSVVLVGNVMGNIWDSSTACPQKYGLEYVAGAHYTIVGNNFLGNTTGTFTHPSGTGAQVANNVIA
jgi:hypothetical protein